MLTSMCVQHDTPSHTHARQAPPLKHVDERTSKRWRKRYFVLRRSMFRLSYYAKDHDMESLKVRPGGCLDFVWVDTNTIHMLRTTRSSSHSGYACCLQGEIDLKFCSSVQLSVGGGRKKSVFSLTVRDPICLPMISRRRGGVTACLIFGRFPPTHHSSRNASITCKLITRPRWSSGDTISMDYSRQRRRRPHSKWLSKLQINHDSNDLEQTQWRLRPLGNPPFLSATPHTLARAHTRTSLSM